MVRVTRYNSGRLTTKLTGSHSRARLSQLCMIEPKSSADGICMRVTVRDSWLLDGGRNELAEVITLSEDGKVWVCLGPITNGGIAKKARLSGPVQPAHRLLGIRLHLFRPLVCLQFRILSSGRRGPCEDATKVVTILCGDIRRRFRAGPEPVLFLDLLRLIARRQT